MQDMNVEMPNKMDMIKSALMKVIDDMTAMESDRLMPDEKKPKVEPAPAESPDLEMSGTSPEDPADGSGLDALMGEADKADASGSLPEDRENDLPPEIMEVVRKKKAEQRPV